MSYKKGPTTLIVGAYSIVHVLRDPANPLRETKFDSRIVKLHFDDKKSSPYPPSVNSMVILDQKEKVFATGARKVRLWKYRGELGDQITVQSKALDIPTGGDKIQCLVFDGTLLVSGTTRNLTIWKIDDVCEMIAKPPITLKCVGHSQVIPTAMCVLTDHHVATGNNQGVVTQWDLEKGVRIQECKSHRYQNQRYVVHNLRFWKERNLLISVGDGGYCHIFDTRKSKMNSVMRLSNPNVWMGSNLPTQHAGLEISDDLNLVVIGCIGGNLYAFDMRNTTHRQQKVLWNKFLSVSWATHLSKLNDHTLVFEQNSGGKNIGICGIRDGPKIVNELKGIYGQRYCVLHHEESLEARKDGRERLKFVVETFVEKTHRVVRLTRVVFHDRGVNVLSVFL